MKVREVLAAVLIVAVAMIGSTVRPASAANPLCPQVCLTGGLLGLGGTRVATSGVSAAASETRTWNFSWTAVDLTEDIPATYELSIELTATGTTSDGVFQGNGEAFIQSPYYAYVSVGDLSVTATDLTVTVTGNDPNHKLTLAGSSVGVGTAAYESTFDHQWDYAS